MSTATQVIPCPACEQALPPSPGNCPHCGAAPPWLDLLDAHDYARRRFEQWHKQGRLNGKQFEELTNYYQQRRQALAQAARAGEALPADAGLSPEKKCWSCGEADDLADKYCAACGAPWDSPAAHSLRYLRFLSTELRRHREAQRITLNQEHDFLEEGRERMAALRTRLEKERIPTVAAAPAGAPPRPRRVKAKTPEGPPRRSVAEILLDPQSAHWLLISGGVLLVIGLVVWLAASGFFENPLTIATGLGIGNLAVLAGGWALIKRTRYQTAGRALTLLACLVMPLNLWFYHAQDLVTLQGHLWVAALACTGLYLASALVLRDPLFVVVLVGGVTLTGLLLLADGNVMRFWEIAAPSTFLVVLGLLCIHAERAFPQGEGPFTRGKFGLAFFWSGHAVLAAGLLLVLGAQVAGDWLYQPVFADLYRHFHAEQPALVTDKTLQLLALGLVLAGTYAYFYSDIVVRRVGVYIYLAVFTLLWAEVLVIEYFELVVGAELAIIALALTALLANLIQASAAGKNVTFDRLGPPLGLFLSTVPVLLGVILHIRATNGTVNPIWKTATGELYQVGWGYVGAMLVTAVACRVGAFLYRHKIPWLSTVYFFGTAAATLVGAAGLLSTLGVRSWDQQAPILMLIPILYLLAARAYKGHSAEHPLVWVGHTATVVMILGVLGSALHIAPRVVEPVTGKTANLLLALFCAEAALFYGLAAGFRKQGASVYLATAMAAGAIWQMLVYADIRAEYYTLAFALLGLGLLVAYRLAVLERIQTTGLPGAMFQSANVLMSVGLVGGFLLTLTRLLLSQPQLATLGDGDWRAPLWRLIFLLGTLATLGLVAAGLVRSAPWRRWYVVAMVGNVLLIFLIAYRVSALSPWQRLELFSVVLGLLFLIAGHVGWYREEDERQSDLVSLSLTLGCFLVGLPLVIAVLHYRYGEVFHLIDEVGLLAIGVILLATGLMFQIRATTLTGGTLVSLYVLTLVLFFRVPDVLKTAAAAVALGGAVIFATGLLLSVYRERLLTLPERIKRREGVFKVLGWR